MATTTMETTRRELEACLKRIEAVEGHMCTLTLHHVGKPALIDMSVGDPECRIGQRWRVFIDAERDRLPLEKTAETWRSKVPTEPDLFRLEGVYLTYEEIRDAMAQLQVDEAVKSGRIKWWTKNPLDREWQLTCAKCDTVFVFKPRDVIVCPNYCDRFKYKFSLLADVLVSDGRIYYDIGGHLLPVELGVIEPV